MINLNSPEQLSLLLFGGVQVLFEKVPVVDAAGNQVVIKSGINKNQLKLTRIEKPVCLKGFDLPVDVVTMKKKKEGVYSTDESTLLKIVNYLTTLDTLNEKQQVCLKIVNNLLKIRQLTKQIDTYYIGIKEKIDHNDDCVRASFLQMQTDTGRLSCTNPNIQNQPKAFDSKVKEHFVSRFTEGKIVEMDYSQLEVCIQAELSQDALFIEDIKNGIDFHCKRVAMKEKLPYDYIIDLVKQKKDPEFIEKRSKIKAFSFARQYGAGAAKISEQTGLTIDECKELIKLEDLNYPQLTEYNKRLLKYVEKSTHGNKGYYKAFTNRYYFFTLEVAPEWLKRKGINFTYRPTQIKNYIVQGTATGDLLPIMLGKFWRKYIIYNRTKYLLINTVHDSIVCDCKLEFVDDLIIDLRFFENVYEHFYSKFNQKQMVPIKIDIKVGHSWYEVGL